MPIEWKGAGAGLVAGPPLRKGKGREEDGIDVDVGTNRSAGPRGLFW
jgi:hypothetical protein